MLSHLIKVLLFIGNVHFVFVMPFTVFVMVDSLIYCCQFHVSVETHWLLTMHPPRHLGCYLYFNMMNCQLCDITVTFSEISIIPQLLALSVVYRELFHSKSADGEYGVHQAYVIAEFGVWTGG